MRIIFFMMLLALAAATDEDVSRTNCGKMLANVQTLFCSSINSSNQNSAESSDNETDDSSELWPWLTKRYVYAMSYAARPKRIALMVDECCKKSCPISKLLSYC